MQHFIKGRGAPSKHSSCRNRVLPSVQWLWRRITPGCPAQRCSAATSRSRWALEYTGEYTHTTHPPTHTHKPTHTHTRARSRGALEWGEAILNASAEHGRNYARKNMVQLPQGNPSSHRSFLKTRGPAQGTGGAHTWAVCWTLA